jgi:competence protein ComEC
VEGGGSGVADLDPGAEVKMRRVARASVWLAVCGAVATAAAQSPTFDIYWVDVEGGAATLVVSPTGESLLVDTGWDTDDDRDAQRIVAAATEAGLTQIDQLVITHYHADHVGGLRALAELIPIVSCLDHGTNTEESNQRWVDVYLEVCGDKRAAVEAGQTLPFGPVAIDIIASDNRLLDTPVNGGGPNPLCATAERKTQASPENQRSVGALFTYGRFTFLDLGDLNWAKEIELSCPVNKVGEVAVYQTSRHGAFDDAGAPTHLYAIKPQVVVVNNGPRKGLGGTSPGFTEVSTAHYERIAASPGIEGIWQAHRSLLDPDPAHNTAAERIANLGETDASGGHWIRASASQDGTFTMTNGRNGFSQRYSAR